LSTVFNERIILNRHRTADDLSSGSVPVFISGLRFDLGTVLEDNHNPAVVVDGHLINNCLSIFIPKSIAFSTPSEFRGLCEGIKQYGSVSVG